MHIQVHPKVSNKLITSNIQIMDFMVIASLFVSACTKEASDESQKPQQTDTQEAGEQEQPQQQNGERDALIAFYNALGGSK